MKTDWSSLADFLVQQSTGAVLVGPPVCAFDVATWFCTFVFQDKDHGDLGVLQFELGEHDRARALKERDRMISIIRRNPRLEVVDECTDEVELARRCVERWPSDDSRELLREIEADQVSVFSALE
jgi:hypothetical protein